MNIIIPIGGKGERFLNQGFLSPKPFINILEKEMIFYVLDNLKFSLEDQIYIIHFNLDEKNLKLLQSYKYKINLIKIQKQTEGAAETILLGLNEIMKISDKKKCIILDCDTFYTQNVLNIYRETETNAVFYTKNYEKKPIYSYIEIDNNFIITIKEKEKISDNANTGIYCFKNIIELHKYAKFVIDNKIKFNNEYYTSCIIYEMLKDNHKFQAIELDSNFVFNLGTPEQLNKYIDDTYLFLFDLDGTLVLSDDIYFNVWQEILSDYKIVLTREIFKKYIQGNNDSYVLRNLIPSLTDNTFKISNIKDNLFLKNIDKIRLVEGSIDFIKQIKKLGHKVAIVTNCNRLVAESILSYIKISEFIDRVIIGNECIKTKPNPEPYLEAINYFNSTNKKAIIFEDSKTGIQSGKNTFPKCLIGIETIYDKKELLDSGVDITISTYKNLNIDSLLIFNNMNLEKIINLIKNSLSNINIKNIEILNHKLKGGFISDVIGLKIETEFEILDCVLKLENKNETFLSKMANDLGLYEREYYFYESISKYVPVKIPEFFGLIKDENFTNIGILMNNLINLNYKLNLNLNEERVDISLKVIERLAALHSKFWNKNLHKNFKDLKKHNDSMFNPKWKNFVKENWNKFKQKWSNILSNEQINKAEKIVNDFGKIQEMLSDKNLTLCHGDVKSANIFYKKEGDSYEPYFIDWQYISLGKGVQDLVFFMIESFEISVINKYKILFKEYYFIKLLENGVDNYNFKEYEIDFENAVRYFPFFVAIWFGTLNEDELLDKNFPFFFIQRLFNFI